MSDPETIVRIASLHLKLVRDYAVLLHLRTQIAKLEKASAKEVPKPQHNKILRKPRKTKRIR